MARLSAALVVLVVAVPLFLYTSALLVIIELGRGAERRPDSIGVSLDIKGVFEYLAKDLWETKERGRYIDDDGRVHIDTEDAQLVMENPRHGRRSSMRPDKHPCQHDDVQQMAPRAQRYGRHNNHTHTSPRGVVSLGPWGGSGGQPFHMPGTSPPRLRSIILYHSGGAIHYLACQHSVAGEDDGAIRTARPWGRPDSTGLRRYTIKLSDGEHVTAVEGTIGHFSNVPGVVITSLTFRTSTGTTYGPYGGNNLQEQGGARPTASFSVPAADGGCIVGFWGRSGWLVDAIGVYVRPCKRAAPPSYISHRMHAAARDDA